MLSGSSLQQTSGNWSLGKRQNSTRVGLNMSKKGQKATFKYTRNLEYRPQSPHQLNWEI